MNTISKIVIGRFCLIVSFLLVFPSMIFSETVGVFFESSIPQIKFAANDVKTALELNGFTVEMNDIAALKPDYSKKKVVISLVNNKDIANILKAEGGTIPTGLGEQAYALQTTNNKQISYWVFGGDVNGAMYGGFQLAENINMNGVSGNYNAQESPFMLYRGIKLNLPLDNRLPTYAGRWTANSTKMAIPHVWDMTFWKKLIDLQCRNRYNVLSIWVHHPFPALVKLKDYPNVSLSRIEGFDGFVIELNHEQRVAFWREVMQYAHNRGMKVYFFNWNVHLNGAYGIDGLPDEKASMPEKMNSPIVLDYFQKSVKALLETYPELDGFGISAGDGMHETREINTAWTWNAIGKPVADYLKENPNRKFSIIHRGIGTSPEVVDSVYSPLKTLPNASFHYSHKYAQAHMYSTPTPKWTNSIQKATQVGLRSWLTIRNDDYFYFNWGDPNFVRAYMAGIPEKQAVDGMYVGSDGYSPSRTYFCKDSSMNGQLEVERRWYMEMLWGRISYNPQISDDVFKSLLKNKYALESADKLFEAWSLASRSLPKVTELIMGEWNLDFHWYPEGCWSDPKKGAGFRTIDGFANETSVAKGSNICDIAKTAADSCFGKKTSYELADEIQKDSEKALAIISSISANNNPELNMAIMNVKQMANLGIYYSYKIRGATLKKAGKLEEAKEVMAKAYCYWINYAQLMETTYYGDSFRNHFIKPDWSYANNAALKEYTDLGGVGIPNCK